MDLNPQELLDKVKGLINEMADQHKKALALKAEKGEVPSEIREKLDLMAKDSEKWTNAYNDWQKESEDYKKRISEVETRLNRKGAASDEEEDKRRSIGEYVTESKEFKEYIASGRVQSRNGNTGKIAIPDPYTFGVKDIVTQVQGTTLIRNERRPGILQVPNIPLTVRSIMSVGRTSSNAVEYVKESTQTNNAGPQWSPIATSPPTGVQDGALKNKSDLSYTLVTTPVRLIATYMKASRQILDDVPQLQSEINNRLLYFLALEEELEILTGDGTGGQLLGIIPQATAYDAGLDVAGDSKIDTIRHALLQVTLSKYMPTNIVLHPQDWHDIELTKTGEGASANTGSYLMTNPSAQAAPRLWGRPVLESLNMTAGDFLVGNFPLGAQLFDRMEPGVQIATQNEDDFIRNMITVLAEERVALAVYRGDAFVEGTF